MKRMKKTALAYAVLAALLLASFGASSVVAATSQTFTLSASTNQLTYVMHSGTIFNGTVATTGMVRVWVSAPSGAEIVNLGVIDKTTTFGFVAPQNGTYAVNFEDDLSNTIQVTFSYVSNPAVQDNNNSSGISLTFAVVTVVIAVVGSALIIFLLRRQNKTQTQPSKLMQH